MQIKNISRLYNSKNEYGLGQHHVSIMQIFVSTSVKGVMAKVAGIVNFRNDGVFTPKSKRKYTSALYFSLLNAIVVLVRVLDQERGHYMYKQRNSQYNLGLS